ncbi:hypothetical protein [Nostoc sp.]|uniref:hypothetical protein n=1 Tax=Nostoc sp. TaxID=1180 RepID=UPI002FF9B990
MINAFGESDRPELERSLLALAKYQWAQATFPILLNFTFGLSVSRNLIRRAISSLLTFLFKKQRSFQLEAIATTKTSQTLVSLQSSNCDRGN